MEEYSEFLSRSQSKLSKNLQVSAATRMLKKTFHHIEAPRDSKFLEIGAALGVGYLALRKNGGSQYTAVEPNSALNSYMLDTFGVSAINEELPNLTKLDSEQYDCVFSFNVLEHAKNHQEALDWVREMTRVCKTNGFILIVCPDIRDYGNYFWDSDWTHGYPTTPNRIAQLCKGLGLKILYSESLHFGFNSKILAFTAVMIGRLIPARFLDAIFSRFGKRNLVSSFLMMFSWGEVNVLVKKV